MSGIEDLVLRFEALPVAQQGRWSVDALRDGRVYLTRDDASRNTLFIVGDHASFGTYPKCRAIRHATSIVPVPGGGPLEALVLSSPSQGYGNRAIAHVAYEVDRRLEATPGLANADLIAEVAWILELLSSQEPVMAPDQQKGLIAELLLLRKLITATSVVGVPAREALARWHGWDRSKRDFAAAGIAIEAKATAMSTRRHHIGSIDQLEPHGAEDVYLFSVGVRLDPTAPRKLPDAVAEVRQLLVGADGSPDEAAQAQFDEGLVRYGYDHSQESVYRAMPGILNLHLPPRLFRAADLDRLKLTSFKGDALPSMVSEVAYVLEAASQELSPAQEQEALRRMLTSPAS